VFWVGEEGVGGELGELAAPEVGAQDALGRHPVAVDRGQGLDGAGILAADQHPIRVFEIADGGAFRQELGVGEYRKALAAGRCIAFCGEDRANHFGGPHRQGALLHHDRVALGAGGHLADRSAKSGFNPAQIDGLTGTDAAGLGGSVHREEHHVGGGNGRFHGGGEVEVATAAAGYHGIEAGLVDGQAG